MGTRVKDRSLLALILRTKGSEVNKIITFLLFGAFTSIENCCCEIVENIYIYSFFFFHRLVMSTLGTIPDAIGMLTGLMNLNLGRNSLTGNFSYSYL